VVDEVPLLIPMLIKQQSIVNKKTDSNNPFYLIINSSYFIINYSKTAR